MPALVNTDDVSSIEPEDLLALAQPGIEWRLVSDLVHALVGEPVAGTAEKAISSGIQEPMAIWTEVLAQAKRQALFVTRYSGTGTGWTQSSPTDVPRAFVAAFELNDLERDHLIRSMITSEAIEGIECSYGEASRLLDEVLREPLIDIG